MLTLQISMPHTAYRALQARYLWLFAFCFATTVALLFTKILLPVLPSLQGGSGLLKHDAVYFQQYTLLIANNIREHGWSAWSLWDSQTETTGNVGILSALYVIFNSNDPALIIPSNALFHATSAYLLLLIGREIWPGRTGNLAGLLAGSLFIIFPSALSWYSQPLKDSYVIAGALLVLYSLLKLHQSESLTRGFIYLFWFASGLIATVFVKPYYIKLYLVITALTALIVIPWAVWIRAPQRYRTILFYVLAIALTAGASKFMPQTANDGMWGARLNFSDPISSFSQKSNQPDSQPTNHLTLQPTSRPTLQPISPPALQPASPPAIVWSWQKTEYLPNFIDKYLMTTAQTRVGLILNNQLVNANTLIDADDKPNSVASVISYLPRALLVGVFAPFPNTWLDKLSIPKLVGVAETIIWYIISPGILLILLYRRSIQLTVTLVFALFFITVFSFAQANVGTIYRVRYAFEFLLILIGIAGWLTYFARHFLNKNHNAIAPSSTIPIKDETDPIITSRTDGKKTIVRSAIMVSALTLIGSLGFFARDFLMARWFGMSSEMDSFALGTMIPMLLVTVFAIPAGAAIIPAYTSEHHENPERGNQFLFSAAAALSILLAGLALALYVFSAQLFTLLNWHYSAAEFGVIRDVTHIYLLILWVGGLTIIGNAALTSVGKMTFPAVAQLIVPVTAFAALLLFKTQYGIYPVAYGMLIGATLNLIFVFYALKRHRLLPTRTPSPFAMFSHLPVRQYTFLIITALSSALLIPIANSMAATLAIGSVAIISMGIKVLLLVTGVFGIGINTVLLPYFSKLIAKLEHRQAQSDFAFFLLLMTLLSTPIALLLTFLVEPTVNILFANSKLTAQDLISLSKVIEYGVIQLPFFACALVAIKYITAQQRSGVIMLSAITGSVLTIIIGSILSKIMGVSGISVAMTLASAVSAIILILYTNHLRHLSIMDSIFIAFNWMMFLTLFLFMHYQLYVGLLITSVAYIILVAGNWNALINEWQYTDTEQAA